MTRRGGEAQLEGPKLRALLKMGMEMDQSHGIMQFTQLGNLPCTHQCCVSVLPIEWSRMKILLSRTLIGQFYGVAYL